MTEKEKGFITLEEVPSSEVEQAMITFLSPFMNSTCRAFLSETFSDAPCVLIGNLWTEIGELFVEKLRRLGVQVVFTTGNGNSGCLFVAKE